MAVCQDFVTHLHVGWRGIFLTPAHGSLTTDARDRSNGRVDHRATCISGKQGNREEQENVRQVCRECVVTDRTVCSERSEEHRLVVVARSTRSLRSRVPPGEIPPEIGMPWDVNRDRRNFRRPCSRSARAAAPAGWSPVAARTDTRRSSPTCGRGASASRSPRTGPAAVKPAGIAGRSPRWTRDNTVSSRPDTLSSREVA